MNTVSELLTVIDQYKEAKKERARWEAKCKALKARIDAALDRKTSE